MPRFLPVLLFSLLFAIPSLAEEPSRWDKVVSGRDKKPVHDANKSFNAGRTYNGTATAPVKSFYLFNVFRTKPFTSRSFWGGKSYATDKFQGARDANLATKYEPQNTNKAVPVKGAETKTAREQTKEYASTTYEARTGVFEGKSQKFLNAQVPDRKNLTVDQVRDLLNKNE